MEKEKPEPSMCQPDMNACRREESGVWQDHQLLTVLDFPQEESGKSRRSKKTDVVLLPY